MHFTSEHARQANALAPETLVAWLGITYHVDEEQRFCATMPVDKRTIQPMGLLHGGATAALAESLGSVASAMLVHPLGKVVVGIEVNANHLKGVRSGSVLAIGELVHQGRTLHVWNIQVKDDAGSLCAVCRLTVMIIDRR